MLPSFNRRWRSMTLLIRLSLRWICPPQDIDTCSRRTASVSWLYGPSEGAWDDTADTQMLLACSGHDFRGRRRPDAGQQRLVEKGKESVGVKRQYRGAVGRHAHRQAGVFLSYASRYGSTLLDRRLYLSQEWTEDAAYTA